MHRNQEKFRHLCILSGCDYLGSLHGVGLKKAEKALSRVSYWNGTHCLTSWKRFGKLVDAPKCGVSDEYVAGFARADLTFLHQVLIEMVLLL
jgi:exonuclease-1